MTCLFSCWKTPLQAPLLPSPPPPLPTDLWLLTLSFLPVESLSSFSRASKETHECAQEAFFRRAKSYGLPVPCKKVAWKWLKELFEELKELWSHHKIYREHPSFEKPLLPAPFFSTQRRGSLFSKERLLSETTLATWPRLKAAEVFTLFCNSLAYSHSRLLTTYLRHLARTKKIKPTHLPLERQLGGKALSWAVYFNWKNQSEAIQLLLLLNADPNYAPSSSAEAPLHTAAIRGCFTAAALLLQAGAAVNQRGPNGYAPLAFAIARHHLDLVELLLTFNADPDLRGKGGSPRSLALQWRDEDASRLISEASPRMMRLCGTSSPSPSPSSS